MYLCVWNSAALIAVNAAKVVVNNMVLLSTFIRTHTRSVSFATICVSAQASAEAVMRLSCAYICTQTHTHAINEYECVPSAHTHFCNSFTSIHTNSLWPMPLVNNFMCDDVRSAHIYWTKIYNTKKRAILYLSAQPHSDPVSFVLLYSGSRLAIFIKICFFHLSCLTATETEHITNSVYFILFHFSNKLFFAVVHLTHTYTCKKRRGK